MEKKNQKKCYIVAKNSDETLLAIGVESTVERELVRYKVQLSRIAQKSIQDSGLTVNEIVQRSGVARSKVSAIKNGALAGISSDLMLRVITAAGVKLNFKVAG